MASDELELPAPLHRDLVARLIAGSAISEVALVSLAVVAGVLLWPTVPHAAVLGWVGAIGLTTLIRRRVRIYFSSHLSQVREMPRLLRLAIIGTGAAWGIGALLLATSMSFAEMTLVMVILCGLSAAATSTLVADPPAFNGFLSAMLIPLALGLARTGINRQSLIAIGLVALFASGMVVVFRRTHRAFMDHLTAERNLEESRAEIDREQSFLDALIASLPTAVVVLNGVGKVMRLNPAFERMFGYSAGEALGMPIDDLIVPADQMDAARVLTNEVKVGRTLSREVVRCRKDGTPLHLRLSAAGLRDRGGGALALYDDITEVRRAEERVREALRSARDAAEQAAAAKSAFLANVSHEIRTPLNGILGLAELLLDSELSADQRRSVELLNSSGESLLAVLNDILDLSKIEAGQFELDRLDFDLPVLVASCARLLSPKIGATGVELVTDIAPDVPQSVLGDPIRLRQVLINLLGNALKFTPAGEVVVSVARAPASQGRDALHFSVRDTGIGIAREHLRSIFEPFRQADATTTRRYGGTGLGLSIARRLVELMGGRLEVESTVGKGSEFAFTIALPVVHGARPATPIADLRNLRVLLVDDNRTNLRVMGEMLRGGGCMVDERDSATAALEALRAAAGSEPYDLLVSDLQMPALDGFGLAERVRREPAIAKLPIMLVTSGGRRGDGQRSRELGIGAFLLKPVTRRELLDGAATAYRKPPTPVPSSAGPPRATRGAARSLHILLAEDNAVNQEVAATMLRRRGHTVDVASNGREAVERARGSAYDVVLMDLQMPELDGYAATRQIRAMVSNQALSIVALTASALAGERERCLAAGMDDYLAKPFKPADLFAVVEGWMPVDQSALPEEPVHDRSVDLDQFRSDLAAAGVEDTYEPILRVFEHDAPRRFEMLENAVRARDADLVHRSAHAFKSMAATIHAKPLAAALLRLETAGRENDLTGIDGDFGEVRRQYHAVLGELSQVGR